MMSIKIKGIDKVTKKLDKLMENANKLKNKKRIIIAKDEEDKKRKIEEEKENIKKELFEGV